MIAASSAALGNMPPQAKAALVIPIKTDPAGQRTEVVELPGQMMRYPHQVSPHGHGGAGQF